MEDPALPEQADTDSGTFAFADLGAEFDEQRLDVPPLNVGAGRTSEDEFEGLLIFSLHGPMVLINSTIVNAYLYYHLP